MSRVAVVTGGGRGIGAGIAEALHHDGWTVVIADMAVNATELRQGEHGYEIALNVTDEAAVDRVMGTLADEFGSISAVVNNAGITRDRTLHKMTWDEWRSVLAVNLDGPFLITRAFVRHLRERDADFARLVNISSISGKLGNFGQANYSASKAGLVALTKVTAREIARFGGTANAVMPGVIDTEMIRAMPESILAQRVEAVPLGRAGSVEDVGEAVRWLCSEGAGYLTGGVLEVTGGRGM
jgi:NAD(P)-dependent dehydrogenase (short-subunit alcohol dehydrogenase family)